MKKLLTVILLTFTNCVAGQIWDAQLLRQTSNSFNLPQYKYASQRLIKDVEAIMTEPVPSVMDKPAIPPSGDKHDYMSLARYWWRNPNTADGLPYVRRDGESNPEIKEYDRDKLGAFASSVSKLTIAYRFTNNGSYARSAVEMLRVWFLNPKTKMNPNMRFGQIVRGVDDMGRAEGVLDSYSFVQVVDAIAVLQSGGYISKKDYAAIRQWFADYVEWMTTDSVALEESEAKNNHGTAYDVQLAMFSLFAGREDIACRVIAEFPEKRLAKQVEADGKQPLELARTTAFGYSTFNLTHFLDMCFIARSLGEDLYVSQEFAVRRAIEYLIPFLGKEDDFPYKQIQSWEDAEADFAQVLWRAAILDGTNADRYRSLYRQFNGNKTKNYLFTLLWSSGS